MGGETKACLSGRVFETAAEKNGTAVVVVVDGVVIGSAGSV